MTKTKATSVAKKVLIADENEFIARTMHDVLTRNGFDAKVVSEGKEAVSLSHHFHPDLIVLNLQLTDMPGLDVVAVLLRKKKDVEGKPVPRPKVIVCSTTLDSETSKLCKEAGVDCLLPRATTFADIVQHVYRLMWPNSRGLVAEIRRQHDALGAMADELTLATPVSLAPDRLEEILDHMVMHAERMHCLEETLLQKESIDDGRSLSAAHNKLRDMVDGYQVRRSAGEEIAGECAVYLSGWVKEHLAECERIAKEHFSDKKW